jgi:CheY-like chemotaxis protein
MLSKMGHTVTTVDNGKQAVEIIESGKTFHLILMDGQMPVMDGFQATEFIRRREKADPDIDRIPIIALTANAMKGDRDRFIEAGMDDYISKPVLFNDLANVISNVMMKKKAGKLVPEKTESKKDIPEF